METENTIFFYGIKDKFGYMSNFYNCTFKDNNDIIYYNSEQYFMKKKQEIFDPTNLNIAKKILNTKNPTEVKKIGRKIRNYNDEIWDQIRYIHMLNGLRYKFIQNDDIKDKLLSTYSKKLYEASHRDKIWGIGFSASQINRLLLTDIQFQETGIVSELIEKEVFGLNLLGKALMEIRDELKKM